MRIRHAKLLLMALLALAGGFAGSSIPAKDAAARIVCESPSQAAEQAVELAAAITACRESAAAPEWSPRPLPQAPLPAALFQRPPPQSSFAAL